MCLLVVERDIRRLRAAHQDMAQLARTDELTGIANRRHFMEQAQQLLEQATATGHPCALLMLDVDHFKSLNDTLGHQAGDQFLTELANRCRGQLRGQDLIGRLGGDEFAVMLPGSCLSVAVQIADRLRDACAEVTDAREGEVPKPVTLSIGVAACAADETVAEVLERADAGLYEAKREGRDGISLAPRRSGHSEIVQRDRSAVEKRASRSAAG
jgi:diguanylate cyclase (GGDEF)-like protein